MKRLLIILISSMLLTACGSEESTDVIEPVSKIEDSTKDNTEASSIKDTAIEANFVDINGGDINEGTALYITGKVTLITKPGKLGSFTLESGGGMYTISSVMDEVNEGDELTVYGVYGGKNDTTRLHEIVAAVIEK